jgi:ABC-type bacteriocin/lantibiotic exporter with double-glycine peptidase domain
MWHNGKMKLKPFEQSPSMCGPASLKMVLSYFDKNYTEKELAGFCSSTKERGTDYNGMIKGAKKAGCFVFTKRNGTIKELEYFIKKEKLPVIINWFDEDDGHYSVVVNIGKKYIITIDPINGKRRLLDKKVFPNIWFDFVGKDFKKVCWGWYMVVSFGRHILPPKQKQY